MKNEAYLWDGQSQLPGTLYLTEDYIFFICKDFVLSHLQLRIQIDDIVEMTLCKLYGVSLNGLKISSIHQKEDVFIVDNPVVIKKWIEDRINK